MIKILVGLFAGIALGVLLSWNFLKRGVEGREEKPADEHKTESRVVHTNGLTLVRLDKATQVRAGIKMSRLEPASLAAEKQAAGRVLDPGSLTSLVVESIAAEAAKEASFRELERSKSLAADKNTSARALEAATAAARRDQAAAELARLRLVNSWGVEIAARKDLPEFVHALSTRETSLIRVDMMPGESGGGSPVSARIATLDSPGSIMDVHYLAPAPGVDPQSLGRGYFFTAQGKSLFAGTPVAAWLSFPGEPLKGVVLPGSAIVRHQGEAFAYIQTADDLFVRREVGLEHPTEHGWFLEAGLKAGETLVVEGAQLLLSEELKGEGGDE